MPDIASPSPQLPAFYSPRPRSPLAHLDLDQSHTPPLSALPSYLKSETSDSRPDSPEAIVVPPSLLSPAFTPPSTPGSATPHITPHDGRETKRPRLLATLPEVNCVVRARIPMFVEPPLIFLQLPIRPPKSKTNIRIIRTTGTEMFLHLYTNNVDNKEHLAIVFGPNIRSKSLDAPRPGESELDRMTRGAYTGRLFPGRTSSRLGNEAAPAQTSPPLVRIHSECYTGETAWSARCDCGEQLDEAARLMSLPEEGSGGGARGGVIVYLRQEGRGIGLGEKLKAYNLQDLGSDTVEANLLLRHPADARTYGLATAILMDLGMEEIRLLTNNPDKIRAVEGPGRQVRVRERVAMIPITWRTAGKSGVHGEEFGGYLKTKIEKMGHMLDMAGGA
ncbi:MAG: GTP cyclohydrolase II [Vezdaea aestivalis]|nr:MAG: GTP cyclohydrolase II [Vezdaea aestivalis]